MLETLFARAFADIWQAWGPAVQTFSTMLLSVLIGAFPFLLVAVLASAILEVFVSRDGLARYVPKNPLLGILAAPLAGLAVPMCECGIIPVARRLVQKGVPLPVALTFMLANPILNPIVIFSTWIAFPLNREMVWSRVGLGYLISVLVGLCVYALLGRRPDGILREPADADSCCGHDHGGPRHHGHDHGHLHLHAASGNLAVAVAPQRPPLLARINHVLSHAAEEFFSVGQYFVLGAILAASAQAFISRSVLEPVAASNAGSVSAMMGLAYLLSICSEADAFVAAAFSTTFSKGAILTFLVFGPMLDIKNTLMMLSTFNGRFTAFITVLIVILCFVAGYLANLFW